MRRYHFFCVEYSLRNPLATRFACISFMCYLLKLNTPFYFHSHCSCLLTGPPMHYHTLKRRKSGNLFFFFFPFKDKIGRGFGCIVRLLCEGVFCTCALSGSVQALAPLNTVTWGWGSLPVTPTDVCNNPCTG